MDAVSYTHLVCFFAPNTSYTSVVEHNHEGDELKNLIYELKENGIEVILDVVFNSTCPSMAFFAEIILSNACHISCAASLRTGSSISM